jgi:CD109 antigen
LSFDLPSVNYVSGVPGAGGMGNINLEVTVQEQATGYEEKASRLISVAAGPVVLRLIPESVSFKPSLPLSVLIVAETPDKKPVDAEVRLEVTYTKKDFRTTKESLRAMVSQGKTIAKIAPPADAVSLTIEAISGAARTSALLQSGYSPTGSFILVQPVEQGRLKVGDTARFRVSATREASNFYYEVLSRGKVVFSDFSRSPDIAFPVSPMMAPEARLLVYQVLPNTEVAADYVPFTVEGSYPQRVDVGFSQDEVKPGDPVEVFLQTMGEAKVGLAAVDRSVFILAENRLNLQQVFAELERLYQKPQVELHEARPLSKITLRGARDTFADAGAIVLSNKSVPQGQELDNPAKVLRDGIMPLGPLAAAPAPAGAVPTVAAEASRQETLAEVQRVRQFFPETWIWTSLTTDKVGKGSQQFHAPDSITTWMLRAVAISKQNGLGISEAQLRVMQPFFVQVDLPYSAIRGEQFPVRVALYNYQTTAQEFTVELERANWFSLLDPASRTVQVGPNSVGAASFTIRPGKLGSQQVKVTARSRFSADAIVKEILIEPEGVFRENVENRILSVGNSYRMDTAFPEGVVEGSARAYLAVTGNYLTQTIQGLEKLIQMPFGCGEQNMILFAPNVFITKYLRETNQIKPEIMAKAETMMVTGYQRELIYRRKDGSFSAFGEQDKVGSLWLTAFVMKTFAQANGLIFVDDNVQSTAKGWITSQQKPDGSFEPVGFVHHQEMMGGLQGKTPLTAYLAVALQESGETNASVKAIRYLEGTLDGITDTYTLAITTYALELAKSPKAGAAYQMLMAKAQRNDDGMFWDRAGTTQPTPNTLEPPAGRAIAPPRPSPSVAIETTAYAILALLEHGDRLNAAQGVKWLVGKRNSSGGFGSTQDTVVGLQALTGYAAKAQADVNATLVLRSGNWQKEVLVRPDNADVLQVIDVPLDGLLSIETRGKGEVVVQAVRRYNLPDAEPKRTSAFQIDVAYGTGNIHVDDLIDVVATVRFTPPQPMQAGMVVLDVAVPTGFAAEAETVANAVKKDPKIKRYDVAGRKVIFYIEDMAPDDQVQIAFKARALFPVRAQAIASQAYAYYRTEWKGESLGGAMAVSERERLDSLE